MIRYVIKGHIDFEYYGVGQDGIGFYPSIENAVFFTSESQAFEVLLEDIWEKEPHNPHKAFIEKVEVTFKELGEA